VNIENEYIYPHYSLRKDFRSEGIRTNARDRSASSINPCFFPRDRPAHVSSIDFKIRSYVVEI